MPLEVEMKLAIPAGVTADELFSDPMVLESYRGSPRTIHMFSRYYDTADGALASRQWTLRHRREGEKLVLCCKTASTGLAAGLLSRGEWQVYSDDVRSGIPRLVAEGAPEELRTLVEAAPELVERCTIEFDRKAVQLELPHGVVVEMSVDEGLIRAGGKEQPLYECELELFFGRPEDLEPLSELFRNKYHLTPEEKSKYARALALLAKED